MLIQTITLNQACTAALDGVGHSAGERGGLRVQRRMLHMGLAMGKGAQGQVLRFQHFQPPHLAHQTAQLGNRVKLYAQALRIADHFARNPKDNPLLVTILALFNQFREIFRINYLRWLSRHKGVPFPSDTELIGILRMNNAYALGELKQTSARWDNRRVFRILGLLREYDAKSKGMNAGGAPDGELLRELLLKIFLQ